MVADLLLDDDLLDLRRRGSRTDPAAVIAEERERRAPRPTANADLLGWTPPVAPAPPAPAAGKPAPNAANNACPICAIRPAKQLCNSCGRKVCTADVWTMLGLCKGCASADDVAHWHRPAAPAGDNWLGGGR